MKKNLLLFFAFFLSIAFVKGQTAAIGDYRSAVASGDWNSTASWQIRNGANSWATPSFVPSDTNNVYIQRGHIITISTVTAKSRNLNIDTLGSITLSSTFNLNIYGKLRAFGAAAAEVSTTLDGNTYATSAASCRDEMIRSKSSGILRFVGGSRDLVLNGEWGNNALKDTIEFAMDSLATGVLNTTIKFSRFVFSSGTVSAVAGAGFSAGSSATDSFIIKSGAKLITARTTNYAISGSSKTKCNQLVIQPGGTLEFTGTDPNLSVAKFLNLGTVVYSSSSAQNLVKFLAQGGDATNPLGTDSLNRYTNLVIKNPSTKTALGLVTVNGLLQIDSAATLDISTFQMIGTLTSTNIHASGILKTASQNTPPIPVGKSWGGTVQYSQGFGGQLIVAGRYNNLTFLNTVAASKDSLAGGVGDTIYIAGKLNLSTTAGVAPNTVTGSTVNFNATAGNQKIPATYYNNLMLSNSSGVDTIPSVDTVRIAGAFTTNTLPVVSTGSTIHFNKLTGGQTIPRFKYHNLVLGNTSNANTLVNGDTVFIAGKLTLGTSATPNTVTGNTVNFNAAAGNQKIPATYFNNLMLSNSAGSDTLPSIDTVRIAGAFTTNTLPVVTTGSTVHFNKLTGGQTIARFKYHNLVLGNTSGRDTLVNGDTIYIAGKYTVGSSTVPNVVTGNTVNFNAAAGNQKIPATYYNNLVLSNPAGTDTLPSSDTVRIAGTFTPNTRTVIIAGSTINFNGTTSQTIPAYTYNNLIVSNNVAATLAAGKVNILGKFLPSAIAVAAVGDTVNFSNLSGGQIVPRFYYYNLALSNTSGADTLINGDTIFINGNTFTGGSSVTPNDITNNTVKYNNLTGGQTVGANYYNNLVVGNTSGTTTLAPGTIYIYGTFTPGTLPYSVPVGSTVNFNRPLGGQSIPKFNFYNLTVGATIGNNTTLIADTIGVAGTFTPGAGNFSTTGNTINFNTTATFPGQSIPGFNYYNVVFTNPNATTYNTLASNINVKNSLCLAGKKGLAPSSFKVIYDSTATFYFTGTSSDTIYKNSPQWPDVNGPKNVTINSLSSTLNFDWNASETYQVTNVQSLHYTATITTSSAHNFNVGDTITIGGLSNSEGGAVFGGTFVVQAPTTFGSNTFTITINYDTTINNSVIAGVSKSKIIRTIPGFLSLYNGGKIAINAGNFLKMANGSTIYRNDSTAQITNNNGFLAIGATTADRVNVTIANTMLSDNEFAYFASPGKYGTLKILNNANGTSTYFLKGSRTVVDLENYGILKLVDTSSTNFYVYGSLYGTGTITGSDSATIKFLGTTPGYAGKLSLTPSFQKLLSLSLNRNAVGGFSVSLNSPVLIKQTLDLSYGNLIDSGNVLTLAGTVTGTALGSHTSTGAGKILMNGTNSITHCLRGGAFTLGNLEIDPGAGNTIYDSTSFTVGKDLTLTSGTYLVSPSTNYVTSVAGNLLGTAVSSGPGKIKMIDTTFTKVIKGVTVDSIEIATTAKIKAGDVFYINKGLILNGNFSDSTFTIPNAGVISGAGTHTGNGRIKMTSANAGFIGNPSLNNIEISASPLAGITSKCNATINGTLFMNGNDVNVISGNTLLFRNKSTIERTSGVLSMSGTGSILMGAVSTDVVNVKIKSNLQSSGELPGTVAPGKIDLTINDASNATPISYTIKSNNKTVRNLYLYKGSLRSLYDTATRAPYSLSVTDTCSTMDNFSVDSTRYALVVNDSFYVAPMLNIIGTFKFGNVDSKTFTANGNMTLKSSATRTANVADITNNGSRGGNNISGNVIVERYITAKKAWRLLSMPTTHNLNTIKAAWQEGATSSAQNPKPGYGIQITSNLAGWQSLGFDTLSTAPSIKIYNPQTQAYDGIASTNDPVTGKFVAGKAYMTFIRGDRSITQLNQAAIPTILREKGILQQNNIVFSGLGTASGQVVSVGNPYASAVDLGRIGKTNVGNTYYYWDPMLGTYGGYQNILVFGSVTSCSACAPGSSYANGDYSLQSGQGFFITTNGGPATLTFTENSKLNNSNLVSRNTSINSQLQTLLYRVQNGNADLYDGSLIAFDDIYSNAVDENDAIKMNNLGENIGLYRDGKILAIETRSQLQESDTIFFKIGQFKQSTYRLKFNPQQIQSNGLQCFLEDKFLNSQTAVSLNDTTTIDFSVNSNAGSYATDRFRLIFKPTAPLPVTFIDLTAQLKEKQVLVNWKVSNEIQILKYNIERSADGINFNGIGDQLTSGNNALISYDYIDATPLNGVNFYRIKSIGNGGEIKYSKIVKIQSAKANEEITISPNPVGLNREIIISYNGLAIGNYDIVLYDLNGRKLYTTSLSFNGVNLEERIKLPKAIPAGKYQLCLISEKKRICQSLLTN